MTRQIGRLGVGILVAFVVLFVQLNRIHVFDAAAHAEHPANGRPLVDDFGAPRGEIRTADGTVIARSVELDDGAVDRRREYPLGPLFAHVTGYVSFQAGNEGLERHYDDELRGEANSLGDGLRELLGSDVGTADLQTTLRVDLQTAARDALGDRQGSVVALDPRTGAVQAMWSWPTFDPNTLADIDAAAATSARLTLLGDPDQPLLPRTVREVYFPGSTFKMVTAAAAIETRTADLDTPIFPDATGYTPPLTDRAFGNYGGSTCGGPLRELVRRSCNSGFAQLAVELLGPNPLIEMAEAFGFNEPLPLDYPVVVESAMPTDFGQPLGRDVDVDPRLLDQLGADRIEPVELTDNIPVLAQSSSGQFEVKATPMQMALVAAAIANDGDLPRPHLVDTVVGANGEVIDEADPSPWRTVMSDSTARTLREAMVGVVESGTATRTAVDGYVVGAKTGTAQLGEGIDTTHAWIIAFAGPTVDEAEIAVAVIVEASEVAGEQTGGRVAAPVAQQVLQAWADAQR